MTQNTAPEFEERPENNKRRPVAAFALAALAVGGIGGAVTTAAWSDNVFFGADAEAATFTLQGSIDGRSWVESHNADSIQLIVPEATLANLLPGQSREVPLHVKNSGSVSAALTSNVAIAGSDFESDPAATVGGLAAKLNPGGTDEFTLTVTAPGDWSPANQGKSGTVVVTVSGEAVAD